MELVDRGVGEEVGGEVARRIVRGREHGQRRAAVGAIASIPKQRFLEGGRAVRDSRAGHSPPGKRRLAVEAAGEAQLVERSGAAQKLLSFVKAKLKQTSKSKSTWRTWAANRRALFYRINSIPVKLSACRFVRFSCEPVQ